MIVRYKKLMIEFPVKQISKHSVWPLCPDLRTGYTKSNVSELFAPDKLPIINASLQTMYATKIFLTIGMFFCFTSFIS